MNDQKTFSNEFLIYGLILTLAIALRLTLLGRNPLVDSEASLAFQAWQILKGDSLVIGSQVGYLSVTEALFFIFGGGNLLARFWPALTGSALIFVPFLMRDKIGHLPAIVLAAGLALDPALVSVSRIAGSPITALVFLVLALAAFHNKQLPVAFTLAVMGLYSGPGFWLGVLILGITMLVCSWLNILKPAPYFQERIEPQNTPEESEPISLVDFVLPLFLILAIGTFFFTRIQGLTAWPGSVVEFIAGWSSLPYFRSTEVLIHLGVSSPLIIIFGGLGFYSAWMEDDKFGKFSFVWFVTALVLLLVYPGRGPVDLIWLVIPLWIGAARELVRLWQLAEGTWPVWVLASLIGTLLTLNWLTLTGMVFQIGNQRAVLLQWGLIAASLALLLLATTITASEWGWPTAKKGLTVGIAGMLLIYTFSTTVKGAYQRIADPRSLWSDGTGAGQMDLILSTVGDVSISQTGRWDSIEGVVLDGSDSLRWLFRDLQNFTFVESYDMAELPPILVTTERSQSLVPPESYRGQDFVIRTWPGWPGLIPQDRISWIAFRDGPILNEYIILWVRGDILSVDE